jgi:thymidylate synthase (FAD)
MMRKIKLLDHGYIRLIETYGSDERIIEAARMSTDKGFQGWGGRCVSCEGRRETCGDVGRGDEWQNCETCTGTGKTTGDEKLLRYLWENRHSTPFEMAGAIVEVQAPIFVFREWHRHRTQSYSELSARYTPLPNLNYTPSLERLMQGLDGKNKQAGTIRGAAVMTVESAEQYRAALVKKYQNDQELYDRFLGDGVPKELARIHLPVARYSRMRAGAVLRNWFGFLSLRMPGNAQYEIRVYADALLDLLSDHFPRSCGLFLETQHGA